MAGPGVWHLVTGEYPPEPGGVADYTAQVAGSLVAEGAEVHVWTGGVEDPPTPGAGGEVVHRVARQFGPGGLHRLNQALESESRPRTVLIQYIPHSYGFKAMNLPFAAWVKHRASRGDDVRVMFHEVAFPWVHRPWRHNLLAATHRAMGALIVRSCRRVYVSTRGWEPLLRMLGAGDRPIIWAPVPSNVPAEADAAAVARRRADLIAGDPAARIVGHFGTYGTGIIHDLEPALRNLLNQDNKARILLLGSGGERWRLHLATDRADWFPRIIAPGPLPTPTIAEYLRACDLAVQPYPDGASGRRSTLMACLANGVPTVVTLGQRSEPVWSEGAVVTAPIGAPECLTRSVIALLEDPNCRARLHQAGRQLYQDRFALRHTIAALLDA